MSTLSLFPINIILPICFEHHVPEFYYIAHLMQPAKISPEEAEVLAQHGNAELDEFDQVSESVGE